MAGYHPAHEDEFSPKKYAVVGAVKDLFQYAGHSNDEKHDDDKDIMYKQEKLYGAKDDKEDNPLGINYHKNEETDEFGRPKDIIKPSVFDEKIEEHLGEKYKPANNDEIAEVLFGHRGHSAGFGSDVSDTLNDSPKHNLGNEQHDNETENASNSDKEQKTHKSDVEDVPDYENEGNEFEGDESSGHSTSGSGSHSKAKHAKNPAKPKEKEKKINGKSVEDLVGSLPWQKRN